MKVLFSHINLITEINIPQTKCLKLVNVKTCNYFQFKTQFVLLFVQLDS